MSNSSVYSVTAQYSDPSCTRPLFAVYGNASTSGCVPQNCNSDYNEVFCAPANLTDAQIGAEVFGSIFYGEIAFYSSSSCDSSTRSNSYIFKWDECVPVNSSLSLQFSYNQTGDSIFYSSHKTSNCSDFGDIFTLDQNSRCYQTNDGFRTPSQQAYIPYIQNRNGLAVFRSYNSLSCTSAPLSISYQFSTGVCNISSNCYQATDTHSYLLRDCFPDYSLSRVQAYGRQYLTSVAYAEVTFFYDSVCSAPSEYFQYVLDTCVPYTSSRSVPAFNSVFYTVAQNGSFVVRRYAGTGCTNEVGVSYYAIGNGNCDSYQWTTVRLYNYLGNYAPSVITSQNASSSNTGIIVGSVLGSLAVIFLILFVIWWFFKRNSNRKSVKAEELTPVEDYFMPAPSYTSDPIDNNAAPSPQPQNNGANELPKLETKMSEGLLGIGVLENLSPKTSKDSKGTNRPLPSDVKSWTVAETAGWISRTLNTDISSIVISQDIDGAVFSRLMETERSELFLQLGITTLGQRTRFTNSYDMLVSNNGGNSSSLPAYY